LPGMRVPRASFQFNPRPKSFPKETLLPTALKLGRIWWPDVERTPPLEDVVAPFFPSSPPTADPSVRRFSPVSDLSLMRLEASIYPSQESDTPLFF